MGEKAVLAATLTEAEREVLRVFLHHSEVTEVARILGKSNAAIEQRLARARRRLGVRRSIDAAHILARAEGERIYGTYATAQSELSGLPVYGPSDVAEAEAPTSSMGHAEEGSGVRPLPFPTKGRPWNALPIWARVVAIAGGVLVATASALMAAALLETVTRIVRQTL